MREHDVFVSHNSKDKPIVKKVVDKLKSRGVIVWFDADRMGGGDSTLEKLFEAVEYSRTYAILVGKNGFGTWHNKEMEVCVRKAAEENKKVMAVLLPGYPKELKLNPFLDSYTRIDLQDGFDTNEFERFFEAIQKGKQSRPKNNKFGDLAKLQEFRNLNAGFGINNLFRNIIFLMSVLVFTILIIIFTPVANNSTKKNSSKTNQGEQNIAIVKKQQIDDIMPSDADVFITINGSKEFLCKNPCIVSAPIDTEVKWRAVRGGYYERSSYFKIGENPIVHLKAKE